MNEPFWMAPRRLRMLLEDGVLTATEYALLHYLAESGADREQGVATTRRHLEDVLGVSTSTVERAIAKLRHREFCSVEVRPGQRRPFRVWLRRAALINERPSRPPSREGGAVREVMREVSSAETSLVTEVEPAPDEAFSSLTTSLTRARAETETEKEKARAADVFEATVAPLGGLNGRQREELLAAWQEPDGPEGVAHCVKRALAEGRNPAPYAVSLVQGRAWQAGNGSTRTPLERAKQLVRNVGHEMPEPALREELDAFGLTEEDIARLLSLAATGCQPYEREPASAEDMARVAAVLEDPASLLPDELGYPETPAETESPPTDDWDGDAA